MFGDPSGMAPEKHKGGGGDVLLKITGLAHYTDTQQIYDYVADGHCVVTAEREYLLPVADHNNTVLDGYALLITRLSSFGGGGSGSSGSAEWGADQISASIAADGADFDKRMQYGEGSHGALPKGVTVVGGKYSGSSVQGGGGSSSGLLNGSANYNAVKAHAYGGILSISLALNLNAAQNSVYIPTFAQLKANFPLGADGKRLSVGKTYEMAGGPLYDWFMEPGADLYNACAVRLSIAFQKSGFKFPVHKPGFTYDGKNYDQYYIKALAMFQDLPQLIGIEPKKYENFSDLSNKRGIYFFEPFDADSFLASGHIDLIENGQCISGDCYEKKEGTFWLFEF